MEIDLDMLFDDLLKTQDYLSRAPKKDILHYDYGVFKYLNCYFYNETGICLREDIFPNVEQVSKELNRFYDNSFNKNKDFILKNNNDLKILFRNYIKLIKKYNMNNQYYLFNDKRFKEKEFKDIILSFFSQFGDNTYKIAKKYIEENRIGLGSTIDDLYSGTFSYFKNLKSGYIFIILEDHPTFTLDLICHELGHAIDAELFLMSQMKKMSIDEDLLCEVPSTYFEIMFADYLYKNHLDVKGSMILKKSFYLVTYENALLLKNNNVEKLLSKYGEDNDNIYSYDNYSEDLLYFLGYYISEHLATISSDNPKEFYKTFSNFIMSRKELGFQKSIESFGINYDKFKSAKLIEDRVKQTSLILQKK